MPPTQQSSKLNRHPQVFTEQCIYQMHVKHCAHMSPMAEGKKHTWNAWLTKLDLLALVCQAAHRADNNSSARSEHLICLQGLFKRHWALLHGVAF